MLPLTGLAEGEMRGNSVCHTKTDSHRTPHTLTRMHTHTHRVSSLLMQMLGYGDKSAGKKVKKKKTEKRKEKGGGEGEGETLKGATSVQTGALWTF